MERFESYQSREDQYEPERICLTLEEALGIPFFHKNRLRILRNGVEIFPAMLRAIEAARVSIDFLTFVYWRGEIAERMADAFASRARAGVATRVLLDALGARSMSGDLRTKLQSSGVELAWFRPLSRWKFWQANHRTHRKVLVCDGQVAFTGGVGIAEEWQGDARHPGEWRDTHFQIEGPAVRGLRGAFLDNWLETRQSGFLGACVSDQPARGDVSIQVVRSSARVGWSDATSLFHTLVRLARSRIRITTAYFVPDTFDTSALIEAAGRGVEIEVLVPGPYVDARLSQLAGERFYGELVEAGVRIWQFQPTMLHAKVLTVDGTIAALGSPNFNQRSMRRDDEVALTVVDPRTVRELDAHFEHDRSRATPVTIDSRRNRGYWKRTKERAASLLRNEA